MRIKLLSLTQAILKDLGLVMAEEATTIIHRSKVRNERKRMKDTL